ncbi:MAG: deoxyribodipyrimidine photo-lyase [Chloroflexota bacterium]
MPKQSPQSAIVVWYKRDLRVLDHAPLAFAAKQNLPVLPLYIAEPSFLRSKTYDSAHWTFTLQSLNALRDSLTKLGQPLVIRVGEAIQVLNALKRQINIAQIVAHEETTDLKGYARDRAVREWAQTRSIPLREFPNNGVVRGLKDREFWEGMRNERMAMPVIPVPEALRPVPSSVRAGRLPDHQQLRLARDKRTIQKGGEAESKAILESFLNWRGANYIVDMSSPAAGAEACSRLSPHLAFGTISMKTAVHAVRNQLKQLNHMDGQERERMGGRWIGSLRAFKSRLAWRDHFMQKIEMQPDIETENLVRSYDGLRPDGSSGIPLERLEAWRVGKTGFPMVDACMRSLNQTGWLNFRMRAMLVSFAAHDLWLDWRAFAPHLAKGFLDYEPGIHYAQIQMQSGTAGNKTLRVYDPLKQGQDHDPQGEFVRKWLPELEGVPNSFVHAPHLMPRDMQIKVGCVVGKDYPAPLVDHKKAATQAKSRITMVRHDPIAEEELDVVRKMHGSRRSQQLAQKKRPEPKNNEGGEQLTLF